MERLIYFMLLFLWGVSPGFCQNSKVDSLQSLLPNSKDAERVEILHALILDLWLNSPNEAKQYAKKAMSLSASLKDPRLQSISLRLMGGVEVYLGEYDLSILYSKEALKLATKINDVQLIAKTLNNIGYAYYNLGSYSEALENFLRAIQIKRTLQQDYALGNTLNNIGLVYLNLKDFTTAKKYFSEALVLSEDIKDNNIRIYSINNLGQTYLQQGDFSEAEKHFKKSIEISRTFDNKNWQATAYSGLGQSYYNQGLTDLSRKQFASALSIRNKIGDLRGVSEVYYYLSKMHAANSQLDSAFYYINISQSMAKKVQSQERLIENFKLYKNLYIQQNQYDSALYFQSLYTGLREKQFDENSIRSIAGIHLKLKEEENLKQLAIKDIQLQRKSLQANFFVAIAILILVIALVLYWYYRMQKRLGRNLTIKNLKISNQKDEIVRKNKELNILNIEKNNLISIVAHDLKSPLNNIKGLISIVSSISQEEKATEYIEMIKLSTTRLTDMIDKILDIEAIESRKLNMELEKMNFSEVVQNVVSRFEIESQRKQITLHSSIADNAMVNVDKSYIDQVIENLLSNAIKFSPPGKNIFINIHLNETSALCEIRDEGPGLSEDDKKKLFRKYQKLSASPTADETSTGLGLSIVKKFVEAMKGQIWCESEAGNGASFFVKFDLAA
ncbi:tetratricopeptide repeat-containing sensor histidine kinase [Marivirga sp. S37H4]|uniref:histidine kinase n=1 Tax=Marivirga aurantiaca TaxID=2802615 RepID=A0A935C4X4_9BACT|nr:tetratricopeptide repeat protein [Marivirga aurantiaca]MBK6263514.1 tetratricopeptide repeat-containing sensor histidine kinase [Marivirga aurantiaca]